MGRGWNTATCHQRRPDTAGQQGGAVPSAALSRARTKTKQGVRAANTSRLLTHLHQNRPNRTKTVLHVPSADKQPRPRADPVPPLRAASSPGSGAHACSEPSAAPPQATCPSQGPQDTCLPEALTALPNTPHALSSTPTVQALSFCKCLIFCTFLGVLIS